LRNPGIESEPFLGETQSNERARKDDKPREASVPMCKVTQTKRAFL